MKFILTMLMVALTLVSCEKTEFTGFPSVTFVRPAQDSEAPANLREIMVAFDKKLDFSSLSSIDIRLTNLSNNTEVSVNYVDNGKILGLYLSSDLNPTTEYEVSINLEALDGDKTVEFSYSFKFTTSAENDSTPIEIVGSNAQVVTGESKIDLLLSETPLPDSIDMYNIVLKDEFGNDIPYSASMKNDKDICLTFDGEKHIAYTVTVNDLRDLANNAMVGTFTHTTSKEQGQWTQSQTSEIGLFDFVVDTQSMLYDGYEFVLGRHYERRTWGYKVYNQNTRSETQGSFILPEPLDPANSISMRDIKIVDDKVQDTQVKIMLTFQEASTFYVSFCDIEVNGASGDINTDSCPRFATAPNAFDVYPAFSPQYSNKFALVYNYYDSVLGGNNTVADFYDNNSLVHSIDLLTIDSNAKFYLDQLNKTSIVLNQIDSFYVGLNLYANCSNDDCKSLTNGDQKVQISLYANNSNNTWNDNYSIRDGNNEINFLKQETLQEGTQVEYGFVQNGIDNNSTGYAALILYTENNRKTVNLLENYGVGFNFNRMYMQAHQFGNKDVLVVWQEITRVRARLYKYDENRWMPTVTLAEGTPNEDASMIQFERASDGSMQIVTLTSSDENLYVEHFQTTDGLNFQETKHLYEDLLYFCRGNFSFIPYAINDADFKCSNNFGYDVTIELRPEL